MRVVALVIAAVALATLVAADGTEITDFQCSLCVDMLQELNGEAPRTWGALKTLLTESRYCAAAASQNFNPCDLVVPAMAQRTKSSQHLPAVPRDACVQLDLCDTQIILGLDNEKQAALASTPFHDLRVVLPHGSRDYYNVRISYIDEAPKAHPAEFTDFFDYNAQFKYVWPNKTVHTVVRPLSNATQTTTFNIGNELNFTVRMPAKGKGVRGLAIADPCFSADYVGCKYGKEFDIFNRLTQLLNTALVRDVDTWFIVGDNFYDPHGILTPQFMQALTLEAKAQPVVPSPGNHDFWQHGSPTSKNGGYDTYGNGYMQYWVTDTQSAINNEKKGDFTPFDFSVDPSTKRPANANNFFTYNLIGNLAIISYSGTGDKNVSDPLFEEACKWVGDVKPAYVFVLGHWSSNHAGCAPHMRTRDAHNQIIKMSGCKEIAHRIKWFEGHEHTNLIVEKNVGFRVGGMGMGGGVNFGIPYFEITDHGELTIGYFPIVGGNGTVPHKEESKPTKEDQKWDSVMSCIEQKGLGGCKDMSVVWHHQKLDD